jgi:hypothetical protein
MDSIDRADPIDNNTQYNSTGYQQIKDNNPGIFRNMKMLQFKIIFHNEIK